VNKVLESFSLRGKTALVTGGAGLYGRQLVAAMAEAGADTYLASRHLPALEEVAAAHRAAGERVTALAYDQGDEASIRALRDEIVKRSGRIDVLVNNSVARPMKGWDDDAARFDESMHINATGVFMVTRAVGEVMIKQAAGSIINIGSMMGMVGVEHHNYDGTDMSGFYPDYFFHKGGMINLTRFCASYFGRYNVRVNCVSPGGFFNNQPARFVAQYSQRTQLNRMANDTDLKGVVVFLASDAAGYITGANIPVDGGYTAK
jgi:NAD(P)-dependent dehydrogenase (short-subunit alcohol dehydrogenase family)